MLGVLFFGAGGYLCFQDALRNKSGAIIDHIIPLSPSQATVFYWVMAAASIVLVLGALFGLYVSLVSQGRLVLTTTTLSVPRGLSSQPVVIQLTNIATLQLLQVGRQLFIRVITRNGRGADISKSYFADASAFEDFKTARSSRLSVTTHPVASIF